MKVKNNRLYPYPVLSVEHDDYIDNTFKAVKCVVSDDSVDVRLECSIAINDEIIKDLIKKDVVGLFCHIECSNTKFRKAFKIDNNDIEQFSVEILSKDVCDSIEVCFALVANKDIDDYKNPNLNEFYQNITINLLKYRTLGYTPTEVYKINKRLNTNGEIPSIFDITKSENDKTITYDYHGEKIVVFLPSSEYSAYENTKGNAVRIKQMMVIVPVLSEILSMISSTETGEIDEYPWYFILENFVSKIEGYSEGFESSSFKNLDSPFKLAQQILRQVSCDAFKELDVLVNREED